MVNSIKKFYKSNKMLVWGFMISLVGYISYYITINWHEIIPYGGLTCNLLSQLALAYMGCFIFYIMQVYIPEENKKKKIKESISYGVQGLVKELEELNNLKRNPIMFSQSRLLKLDNGKITYLNYFEFIKDSIDRINRKCDIVYKNIMYLDDELIKIINKLYDSKEIEKFNLMYYNKSSVDKNIQVCSVIDLNEYCGDLGKLKSYLEN